MLKWLLLAVIPFLALAFEGIRRKLLARMQHRIGPPVWQPFLDIAKLWEKGKTDTRAAANILGRLVPPLYFIATLCLFAFVPLTAVAFAYDFILLIYITILCSGFYVLTGFASNSPFGIIGGMREMATMVKYEICLAALIFTFMLAAEALSFAEYAGSLLLAPLSAACLFAVTIIEIKVTPFDTAEAPPEIMDGYKTEFSGKGLALLELTKYMKFTFFAMLMAFFFFGVQNLLLFAAASLGFVFLLTLAQATTPRFRLDQAIKFYTIIILLALLDLGRVILA